MEHQVLLFYTYTDIDDPETLAARTKALSSRYGLTGRVLIAQEGVNATLEGTTENTEAFIEEFMEDARFRNLRVKRSRGTGNAFPKLSVKVRQEIVGTRFPDSINPRIKTAPRVTPDELRSWFDAGEDFAIVDMRNDYEYRSGHFKNAINPGLENSRDLPAALPRLAHLKDKKVLTVCTGGVRCEKMSALLMAEGFGQVYQLEDGIHAYMEKFPGKDFLGTLYTFDGRVVMDFGGEREIVGRCTLCGEATESYANCANDACHLHFLACEKCQAPAGAFCTEACRAVVHGAHTPMGATVSA